MNEAPASFWTTSRVRAVVLLVAAILLWLAGWWMGRAAPMAEAAALNEQLARIEAQVDARQREGARVVAAGEILQSHVALLQAINELDQRNFGLAESHLQIARERIAEIDSAAAGVDATALSALKQRLQASSVTVAADLNVQRQQLLSIEAQFRSLSANSGG